MKKQKKPKYKVGQTLFFLDASNNCEGCYVVPCRVKTINPLKYPDRNGDVSYGIEFRQRGVSARDKDGHMSSVFWQGRLVYEKYLIDNLEDLAEAVRDVLPQTMSDDLWDGMKLKPKVKRPRKGKYKKTLSSDDFVKIMTDVELENLRKALGGKPKMKKIMTVTHTKPGNWVDRIR